ncbi:MAG: hypothetical protein U5L04_03020 [Trueperaceae bacterium]|nr:hypothetical protein [Trueperaceae bacterium]
MKQLRRLGTIALIAALAACAPATDPASSGANNGAGDAEAQGEALAASGPSSRIQQLDDEGPLNAPGLATDYNASGVWEGVSTVDEGSDVGTRFEITQTGILLSGGVFFDTGNGFEYYGELRGIIQDGPPAQGLPSNVVIVYPAQDNQFSYTSYLGRFRGPEFVGDYRFVDVDGVIRSRGEVLLSRADK